MKHEPLIDRIAVPLTCSLDRRGFLKCLGLAAVAANLPWLSGCSWKKKQLILAILPSGGFEPLYLARDLNWLPNGVRFREGKAPEDSMAALSSGVADAACITLDEMLRGRAAGLPLFAGLVFDSSAGADLVLSRPDIQSLAEVADRRLGFDQHSQSTLVFQKVLQETGLPASAFKRIDLPLTRQVDAWHHNQVDALITFDPTASVFLREGALNLFDSRQMPDTIIHLLAVRRDHPHAFPLVPALVASHFRALEYIGENEQDALYRIAGREESTPEEVRRMLSGVICPSLAVNRRLLQGSDARLIGTARILSKLMVSSGDLAREDDLANLIMPKSLPNPER